MFKVTVFKINKPSSIYTTVLEVEEGMLNTLRLRLEKGDVILIPREFIEHITITPLENTNAN